MNYLNHRKVGVLCLFKNHSTVWRINWKWVLDLRSGKGETYQRLEVMHDDGGCTRMMAGVMENSEYMYFRC